MVHRLRWPIVLAATVACSATAGPVTVPPADGQRWPASPTIWERVRGFPALARIADWIAVDQVLQPPWPGQRTVGSAANAALLAGQVGALARADASYALSAGWIFSVNSSPIRTWNSMQWSLPVSMTLSRETTLGQHHVAVGAGLRYWKDTPTEGGRHWAVGMQLAIPF
jgi:hypothetical protein